MENDTATPDWRRIFRDLCNEPDECLRVCISEFSENDPLLLNDFDFLDAATDALADEHHSLMTCHLYDYNELDKIKQVHYTFRVLAEGIIKEERELRFKALNTAECKATEPINQVENDSYLPYRVSAIIGREVRYDKQ